MPVGCVLLLLVSAAQPVRAAEPVDAFPGIAASYLVKQNEVVRWAGAADRRLSPASLTKLMTALLVVEDGGLDQQVVVGRDAVMETGTRIGLRSGERWKVIDLLAASLIASANDACQALALHAAGAAARFVQRMNRRAAELGLADSHFANACGHDAVGHYSTARNLAVLAEQALGHAEIARLVALRSLTIASDQPPRQVTLHSSNALLGRYPGVIGVKTGFTPDAGKCLVALAERRGQRVLLVLLDAPDRWWSASDLFDRAFAEVADAP